MRTFHSTGLPDATKDIGNWTEPLGLASLLIEGCLVLLAIYRLVMLRQTYPASGPLQ